MAETSNALFYNSENGDRVYDADSFEHLLKKFFTSGVFAGSCQVTADGEGMTCSMAAGYSNCDGKVRFFGSPTSLALQNASPTYDRIDTVVIERNDSNREITAKVVTGAYSAAPVPTAPVRSGGVYQLVVAEIYVAAGVVKVTQANVTDRRPITSVCGYVMCAVDTPDFSELYSQFTTQAAEVIGGTETEIGTWKEAFEGDFEEWRDDFEEGAELEYSEFVQHLSDYLTAFQDAIAADESTAAGDLANFKATIQAYIAELARIIDDGTVAPLQRQVDELEEDFRESPWRRPVGEMTDQSGNPITDFEGHTINITTLSQAEIAAGVINAKLHY